MVIPALMLEVNEIRKSEFASDPTLFKEAGFAVLGGALLAVNLNLSEFIFLGRTSALTMNVAAIFKVCSVANILQAHLLLSETAHTYAGGQRAICL